MNEVKFACTVIKVDNEVVAKVTSFKRSLSISEEDVTGSEDCIAGTDVLHIQMVSIAVDETAEIEGIAIESALTGLDIGQSELRDAAETGKIVSVRYTRNTGYGFTLNGFFTKYDEEGSTSEVYKFKGSFRINSKTEIVPGS
jgi:hypothetical protein